MTIDERLRADGSGWRQAPELAKYAEPQAIALPTARRRRRVRVARPRAIHPSVFAAVAVLAAIIGVVGYVAFGRQHDTAPTGSLALAPASSDPVRPPDRPPIAIPDRLEALPIVSARPAGRLISMPWQLLDVRDGGRTLVVYYVSGDAGDVVSVGFEVIATSDTVELVAVSKDSRGSAEDGSLHTGVGTIELASPLARRALLHAPTDHEWQLP